jgi:tRNA threonylcarbamoyladenosine biosynthesis protein TsaE
VPASDARTSRALPSRRATTQLGAAIGRALREGDLVLVDGDLGAGKTFLCRAIVRAIGVPESVRVTSPTFTLMNEYDAAVGARLRLVHADAYRLLGSGHEEDEVNAIGLRAKLGDGWACVVEWGSALVAALGGDALCITLRAGPRGTVASERHADFVATGPTSVALLDRVEEQLDPRLRA